MMLDLSDRLGRALADRYRVVRTLGQGGMATVFLAEDLRHRRSVAIKVMKAEVAEGLGAARFLREIEIAASLAHPNILPLHDSGAVDGLMYFVMPYVEGDTLRDWMAREGSLSFDDTMRIATEVGDALAYAHDRGVIHRDIKPENILLEAGHAVVSDFGIAKAFSDSGGDTLTDTGLVVGTLTYMSPEQAAGEADLDSRSDVYSLACVVYEMLAGRTPFSGGSAQSLLARKVTEEPPALDGTRTDVPVTVDDVLRRALARERDDRFATTRDFTDALTYARTTEAVAEKERVGLRQRRWRATAAVVTIALVAFLVTWGISISQRSTSWLVAVLPFTNATDDPSQEYFVAGAHAELILALSRADVRVISPASLLHYRNVNRRASEIAKELGADAIIDGSTSLIGDSVSLQLRLTNGTTDELIWFDSFGSRMHRVLTLYAQATRAITNEMGITLRQDVVDALASPPEVSPDVYQALLQARFHRSQLSAEGLTNALDYYDLVLSRDAENAAAWAGIASVWGGRSQMGFVSEEEAAAHSAPALEKALSIDSTLAEVQFTLAGRRTWGSWDWQGGERSFLLGLRGDPTNSTARVYLSHLLLYLGRIEEAAVEARRAALEDPFNPQVQTLFAMTLNFRHEYAQADTVLRAVLARAPDYRMALTTLRTTYHMMGRHQEALDMWEASNARDPEALAALERGAAMGGYAGALRTLAELMIARSDTMHVTPWQIGTLYTRAGDALPALDHLERAFEQHDPNIPYLSVDPIFDFLRSEPRFRELIRRIGLPERSGSLSRS